MSRKGASNNPWLCSVKVQQPGLCSRARARNQFSSLSLGCDKTPPHCDMLAVYSLFYLISYILPRDPQGRFGSNRLASLSAISSPSRGQLKRDGTRAETRFRLSANRTSPFKSARASVQSTTGSQGVRISGSNAGYTMFRGSVKSTDYPFHSPVSSPPVRHRVPSHFNWSLPQNVRERRKVPQNARWKCRSVPFVTVVTMGT